MWISKKKKKVFLFYGSQVFKTQDPCGNFVHLMQWKVMESESLKLEFLNGSRFSKTRDAIFHNSSKRCLTNYIEILNVISPLIPPQHSEETKPFTFNFLQYFLHS